MSGEPRSLHNVEGPPRIPGYEIERELGRGTSGIVYRARQISVDRLVALKVMHMDRAVNARSVKRLQREARIAAHLSHPNLISAIDMGQAEGKWWFAMELIEGPSLAERLEKGGRLREEAALDLFAQLCSALQHASEKGVVHRDIKPANILLERPDHPRLADLGLARIEDDPMLTRTGATLGTPHYVSPEQARDPALADVRSDIWSLGATLYHAVCGRPPFSGSSTAEILSSVLYSPIPDPLELRPELSKGLGLVLRKCLSRDPDRRYFAPAELAEDLARVAAHKPPAIRRASLEPLDPTRAERRGLVVGALAVAAIGALIVLMIWKPWAEEDLSESSSNVVAESSTWRPLERFEANFEAGRMKLATAFAELEDLRGRVPEQHRFALEEQADELKQALQKALAAFWIEANRSFDAILERREFAAGRRLLSEGLADLLLEQTGFAPANLPGEVDRTSFGRRVASLERTLRDRSQDALEEAAATMDRYVRLQLLPEVDRKRRAGAWNEARALLALPWAELCNRSACDLRGLDKAELKASVGEVTSDLEAKLTQLEADWSELDRVKLFGEVRRLAALASERIRTGTDPRPLETFERDFESLLERHDIDRELLALSPVHDSLNEFIRRRSELQDEADERAQEVGTALLSKLELEARPFYAARDYGAAIRFWESHQDSSELEVVQDIVGVRLEGAQELLAFLKRATAGVEALQGKSVSVRLGSITVTGKVEVRGDPLERGFRLRETGGSPLVLLLIPDADIEGTLLDAAALERFATEGANLEADIGLQLQRALFRFHEGDFKGANALLASEALQGGLMICYDLGLRVAGQLGEEQDVQAMRRSRAEEEVERLTGPDADAMDPEVRSFEIRRLLREYRDVLSDRAQSILVQTRRALESDVPPSTLEDFQRAFEPTHASFPSFGAVSMEFRFDGPKVGKWQVGNWFFTGDGWGSRRTELERLEASPSPTLALGDPLLVDTGSLEVRVRIHQPKDSPPELLAISALGFHAVFVGPLGARPAHLLSDTKPLGDVAKRAREGEGESFAGFQAGREHEILLRLSRGSGRLSVSVDGEPVDSGFLRASKASATDDTLTIRSIEPVELRSVTILGDRR